jgi:membrane protein YdbS with pleckstrin-like domain
VINLLITAVIFALVVYLIFWAMRYLGAPEPVQKVVTVVIVLVAVIWLLALLPGMVGYHAPWLGR